MIVYHLAVGERHALTSSQLAAIMGLSEREVRRRIRAERLLGAPILSSGAGFFLPASLHDLRQYARSIQHRAAAVADIAHAAERVLAAAEGQTLLEGW